MIRIEILHFHITFIYLMGIKFYKYLESHRLIRFYKPNQNGYTNLFIDGTNIFHIFKDSEKSSFTEVTNLIRILLPQKLIYISMDGKCPIPKIQNQEARGERHIPDREELTEQELIQKENWNQETFIEFGQDINREIIYNGRNIEGEGEHKIVRFIKEQKRRQEWVKNQKHYILSNDFDIIFLLIPIIDEDFSIIRVHRNNVNQKIQYSIINLKEVRDNFLSKIPIQCFSKFNFDLQKVTIDFVVLSFFLGNDYIQCFKEISDCPNAYDVILESYACLNSTGSRYIYLIYNGTIDKQILERFIVSLASKIENNKRHKSYRSSRNGNSNKKQKPLDNQVKEAKDMMIALNWNYSYYLYGIQSLNYKIAEHKYNNLSEFGLSIEYC